jgi:hypothetical protein
MPEEPKTVRARRDPTDAEILELAWQGGSHCGACSVFVSPTTGTIDVEWCERRLLEFARELLLLAHEDRDA